MNLKTELGNLYNNLLSANLNINNNGNYNRNSMNYFTKETLGNKVTKKSSMNSKII